MRVRVVYVEGNEESEEQANKSLKSWQDHGWEAELWAGYTPDTLDREKFPWPDMEGGRLESFLKSEPHKHTIKNFCT